MKTADDFENSATFLILFIIGFPFLFAIIWCFAHAMLAHVTGWHSLKKLYPHSDQQAVQWHSGGAGGVYRLSLPFAGARGKYAIGAAKHGFIVKSPLIIRPVCGSLYLPYDKIKSETDRKIILDFVMIEMQGAPDVRVCVRKPARDMIEGVRLK